jgi:trigger factor
MYLRNSNRVLEPAEIVGTDGNYIIDVDVLRVDEDGNPFEGSKSENLKIDLTNERVQPEILENSKNKKAGESFSFSFTDERDVKSETGEETKVTEKFLYKAEIKGIEKIILPELNEEFIKKVTKEKAATEPELRKSIKNELTNYLNQQTEELIRNKLVSQLLQSNDFVPPQTLVKNVLEDLIKHEEEHSKKEGWKLDREEAANRLKKQAENEVKWFLLKDSIKRKENLVMSEEDLMALAQKDSENTGITVDKLLNYYKSANYKEKLEDKKLFDFLKENNTIHKIEHNHTH